MSSTSEVVTFADLQFDFLNRVRSVTPTGTASSNMAVLAKRYINTALIDVHRVPGNKFEWAHRRSVLRTHAPYSTGTIDITAAARTTVTGTSTLWNTSVTGMGFANARAGGKIKPSDINEILEVSTVNSDTSITLAYRYTGDALSGSSYTYYEDEYAVGALSGADDFLHFVDLNMFSTDMNIPLMGPQDFRQRFGRNDVAGKPRVATQIQLGFSGSTSPQHRVVLHPYPDNEYSIPYWYVTGLLAVNSAGTEQNRLTDDTDEPIMPRHTRGALVLHALYNYYRDYKDDQRSQETKIEYASFMQRICGEINVGADRPRFIMSRGRSGYPRQRYDVGNAFDELRDRWWK